MATGPNSQKNTKARQEAQRKYNAKPEQKKKRAARNAARREMTRKGKARKGDGKDVMHEDGNALNNKPSNWSMGTKKENRSFARKKNGSKKNPRS